MKKTPKVRLFIEEHLESGKTVTLPAQQSHYLINVLRMERGDKLKCFDNQNGEFIAVIDECGKKSCSVLITEHIRPFETVPDLWLLFAPVKKDKTDFIISAATELGCRKIVPIITRRTITEKVRTDRYQAQVIEASEQSRRVDIPEISAPQSLDHLLKNWDASRTLYFMDETGNGNSAQAVFSSNPKEAAAILTGPEGGFTEDELKLLRQQPFAKGVSLGRRILRAETAVAAALSCWQALCGDWSEHQVEEQS